MTTATPVRGARRPAASRPAPKAIVFERDLDYRQQIRARADRVRWIRVPRRPYFIIEGTGELGGAGYRDAIGTLYPLAYALHFVLKRRGVDAPVGGLEGLYWTDAGPITPAQFVALPSAERPWHWRLMLPIPIEATDADLIAARADATARRVPPRLADVVIETWEEGEVAQLMHIGPYDAEAATIEHLQQAIAEAGYLPSGRHHEIYISDPNRVAPARLKTLLRQPVTRRPRAGR